jgi:lysozyme
VILSIGRILVLDYNKVEKLFMGSKDLPKSKLIQKLEAGNRDIYKEYISFRCYKGKVVPSIERRRKVEYLLLFEE